MKRLLFAGLFFLAGCAAINFSTKDGYGKRGISGYAVYPDVGGVITSMWDKMTKKAE